MYSRPRSPERSSPVSGNRCTSMSWRSTAFRFSRNSASLASTFANASKICCGVDEAFSPSGRFRENRRDTKSARSSASSKSALYIRWRSRFPRRMSMMNATDGFRAAIYVKFCSGPTPRYARPGRATRRRSGMTYWRKPSFDSRLSDRNPPFDSENEAESFQNSWFDSRSGIAAGRAADAPPRGRTTARRATAGRNARRLAMMEG